MIELLNLIVDSNKLPLFSDKYYQCPEDPALKEACHSTKFHTPFPLFKRTSLCLVVYIKSVVVQTDSEDTGLVTSRPVDETQDGGDAEGGRRRPFFPSYEGKDLLTSQIHFRFYRTLVLEAWTKVFLTN